MVALGPRLALAAGGGDLDRFGLGLAILRRVGDTGEGWVNAEVACVDQIAGLAAEDVQLEMTDRGVGNPGTVVFRRPPETVSVSARQHGAIWACRLLRFS